jgi:sulfur carrier protein
MITIALNGRSRDVARGSTVADVLALAGHDAQARGVAVAVNGEVVRRAEWVAAEVSDGDRVEFLTAVQGG